MQNIYLNTSLLDRQIHRFIIIHIQRNRKLFFSSLFPNSTERDILPAVQLLLPKHTTVGAASRDSRRYASVSSSLPAEVGPQAAPSRLSTEAGAADHQVPALAKGEAFTNG